MGEWLKPTDCKSVLFGVRGFESLPSNKTMKMNTKIKIYHDDNQLDVIDKVNELLESHNLELVLVEGEFDGFEIVELVKKPSDEFPNIYLHN